MGKMLTDPVGKPIECSDDSRNRPDSNCSRQDESGWLSEVISEREKQRQRQRETERVCVRGSYYVLCGEKAR